MTKYFELLLDLLEIEKTEKLLNIVKIIESNPQKNIIVYHQYSFLFEGYQKLLNQKLEIQEFLQLGDFQSKIKFNPQKLDSISFLQGNPVLDKETIYIFDYLAEGILPEMDNVYYC